MKANTIPVRLDSGEEKPMTQQTNDPINSDSGVKFPHVEVQLSGQDGNAFGILGAVQREMRRGGCTPEEVAEYNAAATSGDYDHLLQVTMQTVTVL